jgi:hypothetical protein
VADVINFVLFFMHVLQPPRPSATGFYFLERVCLETGSSNIVDFT